MTLSNGTPTPTHLLLLRALLLAGGAHGAELPQVVAPRCSSPPIIDGELSDACWRGASIAASEAPRLR